MSDTSKKLESTVGLLNKKYRDTAIMDMANPKILDVERIPTGLFSLDYVLGGGIPKGRIIEVYGLESCGKTTMALQMLAMAQQNEPKRKVAFIDVEYAFDASYAQDLGVDNKNLFVAQPESGEEALDIVEKLAETGGVSMIIVDSVANLVPRANLNKDIDGSVNIGTTARLLSDNIKRLSAVCSRNNTTLVFINQVRMKIGEMFGNPETTPGGLALKFNASIRLELRRRKAEERLGKQGQPVKIKVKKNKTAPPFRETELFLNYGEGFDVLSDMLKVAVETGIVKKSGGWFEYESLKVQGAVKLLEEISNDEDLKEKLTNDLTEKLYGSIEDKGLESEES